MPFLLRPWSISNGIVKRVPLLILLLLFLTDAGGAQPYRDTLPRPLPEVYEEIFFHTHGRNYRAAAESLSTLHPLIRHLETKYKVVLMERYLQFINQENYIGLLRTLQHLIYLDVKDLLFESTQEINGSLEEARRHLRMAYRNYLLLSPYVQGEQILVDWQIKNLFRKATTATVDSRKLAQIADSIDHLLKKTLPEPP